MKSKLFAFQVAKPFELPTDEPGDGAYDPQTQTMVWSGETRPSAIVICQATYGNEYETCKIVWEVRSQYWYCEMFDPLIEYGYYCEEIF